MEESDESDDEVEMEDDDLAKARSTMLKTQHSLHPPTKESDLASNKWFAVIYTSKRKKCFSLQNC